MIFNIGFVLISNNLYVFCILLYVLFVNFFIFSDFLGFSISIELLFDHNYRIFISKLRTSMNTVMSIDFTGAALIAKFFAAFALYNVASVFKLNK